MVPRSVERTGSKERVRRKRWGRRSARPSGPTDRGHRARAHGGRGWVPEIRAGAVDPDDEGPREGDQCDRDGEGDSASIRMRKVGPVRGPHDVLRGD